MFNYFAFHTFAANSNECIKDSNIINKDMTTEILSNVIANVLTCFDIPFCITVNVGTYIAIKSVIDYKKHNISVWSKRLIFLLFSIFVGIVYCATGSDYKIIFNSFILAPVSWSWILKPICSKFKIDYNSKDMIE